MKRRVVIGVVLGALLAVWGWLAFGCTRPPDAHDYRTAAVEAAQGARDALHTARLTAAASLAGRVTGPYTATVLDDATRSLSGAVRQFAGTPPPDARTAALRDELAPMLTAAVQRLGDVHRAAEAGDPAALRAAAEPLEPLAEQFARFTERYG